MDQILISHLSAFEYWRAFTGRVSTLRHLRTTAPPLRASTLSDQLRVELASLRFNPSPAHPLHLLVSDAAGRPTSPDIQAHLQSAPLPVGAVLRLSEHVLIVCPELSLLQVAQRFSLQRLILLCTEYCGAYSLFGPNGAWVGRPPLTSTAQLERFLTQASTPRGDLRLRRALHYTLDNAESPTEAKTALLLSLPCALGGYGFPRPTLNYSHILSSEAYRIYPHSPCRLDICWPDRYIDLEYDGGDHEAPGRHAQDVARTAALSVDGFSVTMITSAQLADEVAFDAIAHTIASALSYRVRIRVEDFPARQRTLRDAFDLP